MGEKHPSYIKHRETLIALVTHLAMGKNVYRTSKALSSTTSIPREEITKVLTDFKGLFRESPSKTPDTSDRYFSLQIRFARQWSGGTEKLDQQRDPLEKELFVELLEHVRVSATEEQKSSTSTRVAWIAVAASTVAAIIGLAQLLK